ncbi:MAG: Dabb family protein [Microscillaceae bacterium]|nr:Dabb family protein [Microscillaceae bacterium]
MKNLQTDTHIRHTVFFRLAHPIGSTEEAVFFEASEVLVLIPGVKNFKKLKEVSPKNNFTYGFYMEFENEAAYQAYNNHPDHVRFVQEIWLREVEDFMEIDYFLQ